MTENNTIPQNNADINANGNSFTEHHTIKWHNVDIRQEMRPYAFMNLAQEIAGTHANSLHFGYHDLKESNQIWVLSRIKVRFLQYPKWNDKVTLTTWHKGMQSLFGLRDFILRNEQGEEAVVATSSWLIMNTQTRKIERSNRFNANTEILQMANKTNAIEEPCDRLRTQPDMEKVSDRVVMYSDIDYAMHTNNAKYAEWITNSIDIEIFKNYRIKEFQINFNAETVLGDTVEIYRVKIDTPDKIKESNNLGPDSFTYYFEGRKNGVTAFESVMTFAPAE